MDGTTLVSDSDLPKRQLEVQIAMAGGQTMTDPETGRPALFTASGVKEFVFSDDTWP